jgi:pimeloyl-ACP methyl ester carboxylesterase
MVTGVREHDVSGADGTRLRVWRAGRSGPAVLLCPGLGTMPEAWPVLHRTDPGVRLHSWYHRGTFGSARPADPRRITPADHLADALAVLDDAGVERAVLMGWSVGVTTAVELARQHPERVRGLLLVAGPPGDVFGGMLGGLGLPVWLRRALLTQAGQVLALAGPLLNPVLHRVPVTALAADLVRHSGFLRPDGPTEDVVALGRRFLRNDWGWYGRLAGAFAGTPALDLAGIGCPVTMLTGRYDLLAEAGHARRPLAALPQARVRILPTSHFLPLEAPETLLAELRLVLARADAVDAARYWAEPAPAPEPLTRRSPPRA